MARHRGPQVTQHLEPHGRAIKRPKKHLGQACSDRTSSELSYKKTGTPEANPKQGELIEDFCTRCRTKALSCRYADNATIDERILEQLIAGTNMSKIQRELLAKDETLTLTEALEIAKSYEASANQIRKSR